MHLSPGLNASIGLISISYLAGLFDVLILLGWGWPCFDADLTTFAM